MKIRNGFVSNSSSSSFILATTKENLDKVIGNLTEEQVELFEKMKSHIVSRKELEAFGKTLTVFEIYNYHGETPFYEMGDYDDDNYDEGPCEKLWYNTIEPGLLKDKNESFTYSMDF